MGKRKMPSQSVEYLPGVLIKMLFFSSLIVASSAFSVVPMSSTRTQPMSMSTSTSMSMSMSMSMSSSPKTKAKMYAVNLKFSVKPERRQDFISLIQDNQKKTLNLEPAALQYVVGEDVDSPNTFYLHEEFIGAEGF